MPAPDESYENASKHDRDEVESFVWEQIGTALPLSEDGKTRWMFVIEGSVGPGIPVFIRRAASGPQPAKEQS